MPVVFGVHFFSTPRSHRLIIDPQLANVREVPAVWVLLWCGRGVEYDLSEETHEVGVHQANCAALAAIMQLQFPVVAGGDGGQWHRTAEGEGDETNTGPLVGAVGGGDGGGREKKKNTKEKMGRR